MTTLVRNAPIGLKVALAPAFAIACLLVVALAGWLANRSMSQDMAHVGGAMKSAAAAQGYATRLGDLHQGIYQSLTWEAVGQREEKIKALDARLLKEIDDFAKTVQAASESPEVPEPIRREVAEFAVLFAKYRKVAIDTLDIKSAGVATAASYVVTLDQQYQICQAHTLQHVTRQGEAGQAAIASAQQSAARNSTVIAGVSVLALALASALAWLFTRAITRPLAKAARLADALAQGDLSARSDTQGNDETGRVLAALHQVSANLGAIVQDIRSTAQQIDVASSEIASGNADLSSRTENTASALQQTAASVEQLSATIKNSALHAGEANRLARSASAVADEGGTAVAEVVRTMDAINAQAKKIAEIIGTIDGIAFQTNILALNAAVEAARAGEQGRGFSVVAQEVRTLAQRSAEAAREIRTLISSSVEQIDAGAGKVQQAGATMGRIVESIQRVTSTVDSIARAADEQASGIEQINSAVAEMDRATQQNAAMVEEAAAATDALKSQAGSLVQMLGRFRTPA